MSLNTYLWCMNGLFRHLQTLKMLPVCLSLCCILSTLSRAQIPPPGYEREIQQMEERKRTNVLDKDSVTVLDTVTIFDNETYEETTRIISSNLSWRDYMMYRLGINQPDILLNGAPHTLMDPRTYEKLTVQWNLSDTKLDTIRRQ